MFLFGDQNSEADFKNRLNFAPQFSVGKWFNPYLALRLQLNGGVLHGFETQVLHLCSTINMQLLMLICCGM